MTKARWKKKKKCLFDCFVCYFIVCLIYTLLLIYYHFNWCRAIHIYFVYIINKSRCVLNVLHKETVFYNLTSLFVYFSFIYSSLPVDALQPTSCIHYPLGLARAALSSLSALVNYSVFPEWAPVSGYCNDFQIICPSMMNEMEMWLWLSESWHCSRWARREAVAQPNRAILTININTQSTRVPSGLIVYDEECSWLNTDRRTSMTVDLICLQTQDIQSRAQAQWRRFLLLLLIIGVPSLLHYGWYLWWGKWLWRWVLSLTFF